MAALALSLCVSPAASSFGELFPRNDLPQDLIFIKTLRPYGLEYYAENLTENGFHFVRVGQARYGNASDVNTGDITVDIPLTIEELDTPESAVGRLEMMSANASSTFTFSGLKIITLLYRGDTAYVWSKGRYVFAVGEFFPTNEETALGLVVRTVEQERKAGSR